MSDDTNTNWFMIRTVFLEFSSVDRNCSNELMTTVRTDVIISFVIF